MFMETRCWSSSRRFLANHKYWTIARACLRYPLVTQSQGDLLAGQGGQGQVLFELQAAAYFPALALGSLGSTFVFVAYKQHHCPKLSISRASIGG